MPCATEGFSRGVRTSVIIILLSCLILLTSVSPLVRARPSFARLTLQLGACWSLLEVGWCKVEFRISHYALRAPRMS